MAAACSGVNAIGGSIGAVRGTERVMGRMVAGPSDIFGIVPST